MPNPSRTADPVGAAEPVRKPNRMRSLATVVLLSITACSSGPWSRGDYALEGTYLALTAADLHATLTATSRCKEGNPLLGKCGDGPVPVGLWFVAVPIANLLAADALPGRWRTAFQAFTIGVQANVLYVNVSGGVY